MVVKEEVIKIDDPEKTRNRVIQNLSVIAHELYFRNGMGNGLYADQIAEAVKFINWLYGKVYER